MDIQKRMLVNIERSIRCFKSMLLIDIDHFNNNNDRMMGTRYLYLIGLFFLLDWLFVFQWRSQEFLSSSQQWAIEKSSGNHFLKPYSDYKSHYLLKRNSLCTISRIHSSTFQCLMSLRTCTGSKIFRYWAIAIPGYVTVVFECLVVQN